MSTSRGAPEAALRAFRRSAPRPGACGSVRPARAPRASLAAVLLAAAFAAARLASGAPTPQPADLAVPPGLAPSRVAPSGRPAVALHAAVEALSGPRARPVAEAPPPPAGSAAESEAVRRYVRGRQFALEGDERRAAENIDAALRLDPGSAALRSARAELAARAGDVRRAVAEWKAVLAADPDDVQALVALGIAAHESGSHQDAVAFLGRAWPRLAEGGFPSLSDAGRAAIGGALARSLFRTGFDAAGLSVAPTALGVPVERVAAQRGDGIDAASRAMSALAVEAGEAALRCGRPDIAFDCLVRAFELEPSARAGAVAAFAALRAGRGDAARQLLSLVLERAPWDDPAATVEAEWLLGAVGADAQARERLSLAALGAGAGIGGSEPADPQVRARIARLLAASGDADAAAPMLAEALADGARDPLALELAFRSAGERGSPPLAARLAASDPGSLGALASALLRSCRDVRTLRAAVEDLPAGTVREGLAAALLAAMRAPGDAWRRAEAAAAADEGSRVALEALVLAATSALDPALVAKAASAAPDAVDGDPSWQARLAQAYADTGAVTEAQQSFARAELLAAEAAPGAPLAALLADARARIDGRAAGGSPRAVAEAAIRRGDSAAAVDGLLLARAVDPSDPATLGMLVRLLPRSEGGEGARAWLARELAARPNEPMLWEALALGDIAGGRAAEALARIDARLSADPDDPIVLRGREAALRALGRAQDAAAAGQARIASLPPGPRRTLEEAALASLSGDAEGASLALARFAESAFRPPLSMRAEALELARRLPSSAPGRPQAIRMIAGDAVASDPRSPLGFHAFDALGAALERPGADGLEAAAAVAAAAAAVPELRAQAETWRAAADFLLAEGQPAAAAEFLRARLADPSGLAPADAGLLARAAVSCDALAGGRSRDAMALVAQLASLGHRPFDADGRPASAYAALAAIFASLGDRRGEEDILEAGLAVDPMDPVLLNGLGYLRLERGVADGRTEALLEAALAARPDDPGTIDSFAWMQYARGRIAPDGSGRDAVTLLRRAADLSRGAPSAVRLEHLGDALWRAGEREPAVEAWRAAAAAAEGGMDRARHLELLREVFRRRTGLGAVDPSRYHDSNDGATGARARAKADAAAAGREPEVAPAGAAGPLRVP